MKKDGQAFPFKPEDSNALTLQMKQDGNAMMVQRILQMPAMPYAEGQFVYRVVEVRGRRSGKARQVPLAVFQYEGERYLIAPERSRDWVQNLQQAEECLLITAAQQEQCRAELIFDDAALTAVRLYVSGLSGWASGQFPFSTHASEEEIRLKSDHFAIFRLS